MRSTSAIQPVERWFAIGRHGTERVAKVVLIGAVPPLMLKTDANPGALPIEVFDGIAQASWQTVHSSSRTSL